MICVCPGRCRNDVGPNGDLPRLLLGLAGIGHADYDPRRGLLSPLFDTSRRRLLRGTTDYDSLMRAAGR